MIGKVDALSAGYGDANHSGLFELRQFYKMLTFAWDLFILAINAPLDCSLKGCCLRQAMLIICMVKPHSIVIWYLNVADFKYVIIFLPMRGGGRMSSSLEYGTHCDYFNLAASIHDVVHTSAEDLKALTAFSFLC